MGRRVTTLLLLLFAVSHATPLYAGDDNSEWQTLKIKNGMTILEQRQQIDRARAIIRECDQLVSLMKEQDRFLHDKAAMAEFQQLQKQRIKQLIADGQRLKPIAVSAAASQIPNVTNVVLISMSYEGTSAFQTMMRLYEEDKNMAMERLREIERRLPRKWSSKSGKHSVVAEFVSVDNKKVIIRRLDDGRKVGVEIDKLSQMDRQFIERMTNRTNDMIGQGELKEIGIERRTSSP